ncbi:Fic family protein [Candidatus Roizmanbacteria bacterium]|nr:Fic family protein [Candidatus Roizmanbacteria bacterium]
MNDTNISQRQKWILNYTASNNGISRSSIQEEMQGVYKISKPTLIRDLNALLTNKLIRVEGKGKNFIYLPVFQNPLLRVFDLDFYFQTEPDQRTNIKREFNFDVFTNLSGLFQKEEIDGIGKIKKNFSDQTKKLAPDILKRELERFTIELAWKSSKIEGNTYSLLETEALIKEKREATGKSKEEAIMILNHKAVFETILKKRQEFKKITLFLINQLHNLMVKDLNISTGIRKQAVGITGTAYKPLDNQYQIKEATINIVKTINENSNPLEKALIANTMISYVQPYSDGNKRTARMLANAILLAYDYYPLSYRSINEDEFKKALILFYEQNSLYHCKRLFIEQLIFAYNNYFR